jgi:hypothetical protein
VEESSSALSTVFAGQQVDQKTGGEVVHELQQSRKFKFRKTIEFHVK